MRCQRCNHPMAQTRYSPGEYKVFVCSQCGGSRTRREHTLKQSGGNYSGQVVINSRVDIRHQEKG